MGLAVGLDLGTTRSVAAAVVAGAVVPVRGADGAIGIPSAVCFPLHGDVLVGNDAVRAAARYPDRAFWSFKHLLGAFDRPQVIGGQHVLPEDLATLVVRRLVSDAEAFFGEPIDRVTVTVPAGATQGAWHATRRSVQAAGVDVLRIYREPVAAAVGAGFARRHREDTVLVFDLGGGTLDVTVLEWGDGVFEVKAVTHDSRLGGDDFDLALVDHLISEFQEPTGLDLRSDPHAMVRLFSAAELAKR